MVTTQAYSTYSGMRRMWGVLMLRQREISFTFNLILHITLDGNDAGIFDIQRDEKNVGVLMLRERLDRERAGLYTLTIRYRNIRVTASLVTLSVFTYYFFNWEDI